MALVTDVSKHAMPTWPTAFSTAAAPLDPASTFRVDGREIAWKQQQPTPGNSLFNFREAYGLDLECLKDSDGDGFPDIIDPAPFKKGFKDGVNGAEARDR